MSSSVKVSTMTNTSGLHPLGRAVLVKPFEMKSYTIVIPDGAKERSMMVEMMAVVVEVGPEAWREEKSPRCKPGDKVMISRWCGHIQTGPLDKLMYRLVNAEDIFSLLDPRVTEEKVNERVA